MGMQKNNSTKSIKFVHDMNYPYWHFKVHRDPPEYYDKDKKGDWTLSLPPYA